MLNNSVSSQVTELTFYLHDMCQYVNVCPCVCAQVCMFMEVGVYV